MVFDGVELVVIIEFVWVFDVVGCFVGICYEVDGDWLV